MPVYITDLKKIAQRSFKSTAVLYKIKCANNSTNRVNFKRFISGILFYNR